MVLKGQSTTWQMCLLTCSTDFRLSLDKCIIADCSFCSFKKLLYSSRALCSSSFRFCKYLGIFPKCCKQEVNILEKWISQHQNRHNDFVLFFSGVCISMLFLINSANVISKINIYNKPTSFLLYLGTSPEFSRSCLSPFLESTEVGCGFIGSIVTVFMKFLLVRMPIGGGSVLSGTGGFLTVQVRVTTIERSFSEIV